MCTIGALIVLSHSPLAVAEPEQAPRMTVAVTGFGLKSDFAAHYGGSSPDGGLAAILTSALEQTDRFLVVDRLGLGDVLAEQELTAAGLVRSESAATPGQLLGARLLISGNVTEFASDNSGNTLSLGATNIGSKNIGIGLAPTSTKAIVGIDVRVVDATSGEILASFNVTEEAKRSAFGFRINSGDIALGSRSFEKTALGKAARQAIYQVVERVVVASADTAWSGLVVDAEDGDIVINAGNRAGVEVGERYEIYRTTKVLRDPSTGRILGERKKHIGSVEIVETADEMSFAQFIAGAGAVALAGDKVVIGEQS